MIDPRIGHLRAHEGGRRLNSLHPDRHVLDRIFLALMGELEPAVGTDPKTDVVEPGPGIVVRPEQHSGFNFLAVAHAKRLRGRTRHVLLDVFEVNIDGRMPTCAVPILEDVGVAVDDHCRRVLTRPNGFNSGRRDNDPSYLLLRSDQVGQGWRVRCFAPLRLRDEVGVGKPTSIFSQSTLRGQLASMAATWIGAPPCGLPASGRAEFFHVVFEKPLDFAVRH